MQKFPKAILFDFDYTLTDSSESIVVCMNHALAKLGFLPVEAQTIKKMIGRSAEKIFQILIPNQSKEKKDEFIRLFRAKADEVMVEMTEMYPSVPETLRLLHENKTKLGIVTTKRRYLTEAILEKHGIRKFFEIIVGGEDVTEYKPSPEGLLKALVFLDTDPAEAVYVGDSLTDAETAKRAETPFIAVLSGMTTREDFKNYQVKAILKNVGELPTLLQSLNQATLSK